MSIPRAEEDQPVGVQDQGASIKHVYGIFLRRWRAIVATALVVFAGIVAYTMLSPRIYTATTLVMVNPGRDQVISQEQMMDNSAPSSSAVDSEIEVLRSQMLRVRLVEAMNLEQDPEWNGALRAPGPIASALAPLRAVFAGGGEPSAPDVESQRDSIARAVSSALSVRRRGQSYGIEVSIDSRDPRRAAEMVNQFVQLYLESQTEARFEASQRANDWLSQRLDELRLEVQEKERAAEAFRTTNGLSAAAGGADTQQLQSSEVQTMLVQSRADLAEKEARLRQVQQLVRAGASAESIASALNSPVVAGLRTRESDLAQRVAELRQRYSPMHPSVLTAEIELDDVRRRIQDEIRRISANLQNEVEVARARLDTLQRSFGGVSGARDENNEAAIQYRELLRDASAARSVLESFSQRFHELADQGDLPIATSRVVSAATPPSAPSKPNLPRYLLLAVLLAALCGPGIGFLIETLDSTIASAGEAERKLGALTLASVPILKSQDWRGLALDRRNPADYLVEKPASRFAEALRVLQTSLTHARIDHKVLAITSAVQDEGKTTMSLCLARIAAMSGRRVALVDCDLRRHSLSELVGGNPRVGLLEVLSGQTAWRDAMVQDPASAAHLLPTPASCFTPLGVFESQAMQRLLEELRANYDLVILDSAPVLAIADSRTVAAQADLALVVVRSDKTPAAAVRIAIRELTHAGANLAGVALNYIDPRRPGRGTYDDALHYSQARSDYQN